jgi:hypothetical protein
MGLTSEIRTARATVLATCGLLIGAVSLAATPAVRGRITDPAGLPRDFTMVFELLWGHR